MRTKITLILALLILPFIGNKVFSQTVSGVASNTGCQNSGIVTSSSTGLGATPQYQLLKAGVVVSPVPGDNTQFTTNPVFTGLSSGIYVVNGRATAGGTVYSSGNITVSDGYTSMTVSTPTKVANCVGGTAVLTSTVTNGKAPFTFTIAAQATPGTILQSSGAIAANTFAFNGLPANSYIVSVTDSCGLTITGATSISNPTVGLNDIKLGSIAYPNYSTTYNCSTPLTIYNETLFQYISNSTTLSVADAANFSWKIKYQGQLYGQDIDADGYSDIGGAGYSPLLQKAPLPIIANRAGVEADINNMKVVLIDNCGNQKEFQITQVTGYVSIYNCGGVGIVRLQANRLACYPMNITFTNINNSSDVITKTATLPVDNVEGLTAGATYHVTYVDAAGVTTGNLNLPVSQNITIPSATTLTIAQSNFGVQQNLNALGYGRLLIGVTPVQTANNFINYTVTASNNPLVPVGYSSSYILDNSGNAYLPKVNATDPNGYWPKGNYTLDITTSCGTRTLNVTVKGYLASLSGNTTTPVCGGFNYVMNGTFDDPTAYQVIVVSGPSSVGQVRDMANATSSLPFNGLGYGTYTFGLRIKGGTQDVLTQTITYDANNAIIVDKTNTGGYVCATGATNGVLTITATSNSPAPGNVLEYALSTDGGVTFGPYQSGNTFTGLTDNTYFFRIKDGCGNVITQSVQIGVAAAPEATANGLNTPAVICDMTSGTVQLDVDIFGALSYLWTGPGINASNQNQKDPLVNYSDLTVGANNYTCTVALGAPCSSSTVSNLTINVNPRPVVVTAAPAAVCFPNTIDLTAPAVTAGSAAGLTYTYFSDEQATIPVTDPTAVAVQDTYYIKGTDASGCFSIAPVEAIVNALPQASIAYLSAPYCQTGTAVPEELGTAGGTYTSDAGLIIDADTGEINLAASTLGVHTITYTFNDGSCSNTATTDITINALPTASISYPAGPFCNRGTVSSVETGVTNGQYSADAGLSIDGATGEIDLALSAPGTYTVTYEFSNGTCSNAVTTDITINPTVLPSPLVDVTAECSVTPTAPTLTDSCAGTITGTTATTFPIATQGITVVSWTFDYGNGYTQTVNQNVIIDDATAPLIPTLADATGECSVTPTAPTTTDACSGTITGTTTTIFPITAQGTTVVTWTFDDGNGNTSTANQNVILDDVTAPIVPILADVTGECSVTPTAPTTTDNCAGTITGTTTTVFPITAQGTTVVTWTFDDGNGNTSTANQNVILDDVTAPIVPILA
ncbi:hypothetical protein, partial [Flavobacterium sp. 3-210]